MILTAEFIEQFNALKNMIADVHIKHLLYGNQKIKGCVLHPFVDGGRIGLRINSEDVYITMDELQEFSINDVECIIKSEVMELHIVI
jgi:hypothetical protein